MSDIDFDLVEKNKFWKNVVGDTLVAIIVITISLCVYYSLDNSRMINNGYEYRRVAVSVRTVADYEYKWVKIGSPESKEDTTIPQRAPGE